MCARPRALASISPHCGSSLGNMPGRGLSTETRLTISKKSRTRKPLAVESSWPSNTTSASPSSKSTRSWGTSTWLVFLRSLASVTAISNGLNANFDWSTSPDREAAEVELLHPELARETRIRERALAAELHVGDALDGDVHQRRHIVEIDVRAFVHCEPELLLVVQRHGGEHPTSAGVDGHAIENHRVGLDVERAAHRGPASHPSCASSPSRGGADRTPRSRGCWR